MKSRVLLLIAVLSSQYGCAADGGADPADPGAGGNGVSGAGAAGATSSAGGGTGGGSAGSTSSGGAGSGPTSSGGMAAGGSAGAASAGTGGSYVSPPVDEESFAANEWTTMLNWDVATQPIQGEGLLKDPVRGNDLYAFYTDANPNARHVMKSTDYGLTWASIQQTPVQGSPWGVAIDPNPARDPETPPTLYTPAGYGDRGLWKSTDGGITWTNLFADMKDGVMPKPGGGTTSFPPDKNGLHNDFYQVAILQDDPPNHLLVTYHEPEPGQAFLAESKDGGLTWEVHPMPWGYSDYVVAIDESTWLVTSQAYGSGDGIYRTTTAGRVDGVISVDAWVKVDDGKHEHGQFTPLCDNNGDLYFPTTTGVRRSTDAGVTWSSVYEGSTGAVLGTDQYIYLLPAFVRASRDDLSSWTSYTTTPSDWDRGAPPFGAVSTQNGTHSILLAVNYGKGGSLDPNGDIWRFKEQ